jgi:hypothetical protein
VPGGGGSQPGGTGSERVPGGRISHRKAARKIRVSSAAEDWSAAAGATDLAMLLGNIAEGAAGRERAAPAGGGGAATGRHVLAAAVLVVGAALARRGEPYLAGLTGEPPLEVALVLGGALASRGVQFLMRMAARHRCVREPPLAAAPVSVASRAPRREAFLEVVGA